MSKVAERGPDKGTSALYCWCARGGKRKALTEAPLTGGEEYYLRSYSSICQCDKTGFLHGTDEHDLALAANDFIENPT